MTRLAETLETALTLHQQGRFPEAETAYRELVHDDPFDADALHLLGVTAHQQGRNDEAADCIIKAIAVRPRVAAYHNNLGAVLHALSRSAEALAAWEEALRLAPEDADAHFNMGTVLAALNRLPEAIDSLRTAVNLRPESIEPNFHLGNLLRKQGREAEAEDCYRRVLRQDPGHHFAHNNLGSLLHNRGELEEALALYRQALKHRPDYAAAHINSGIALKELGRFEEARDAYEKALNLAPDSAELFFNLGNLHREWQDLPAAADCYRKTLAIDPAHLRARVNLGVVHKDLAEPKKAELCNDYVLRRHSHCAEARFNRALVRLQQGDFEHGWDEYEWRWKYNEVPPRFTFPAWDGGPLDEKTLLIFAEQGIGDEIMFASCLPEIIDRAGACLVECGPRLLPLFARSFPRACFLPKPAEQNPECAEPLSRVDVQCAIGSLPRFLRRSREEFPARERYLTAGPAARRRCQRKLAALGPGPKIGISWRGGKEADVCRKRSTTLDQWQTLFGLPGLRFLNLQYGECNADLEAVRQQTGTVIHVFRDMNPLSDIDAFAALVAELDMVISVDNSTVHLAGALGVPTRLLLPVASDWRWQRHTTETPWYQSLRLIRQPRPGDWESVFFEVAAELKALVENQQPGC